MGVANATRSAGMMCSRTTSKSSLNMQGPFMPHLLQAMHGCTLLDAASKRVTSCPASLAPLMKCSARVLEFPFFRGLPVSTNIFIFASSVVFGTVTAEADDSGPSKRTLPATAAVAVSEALMNFRRFMTLLRCFLNDAPEWGVAYTALSERSFLRVKAGRVLHSPRPRDATSCRNR